MNRSQPLLSPIPPYNKKTPSGRWGLPPRNKKPPWGGGGSSVQQKAHSRALVAVTHLGLGPTVPPIPGTNRNKNPITRPRKTGTIRNNFRTQSIGYQSPPHFVSLKNYQKLSTHTPIRHMFHPPSAKNGNNRKQNGRAIAAPPFGQSIKGVRQPYAPPTKHYVANACLPYQRKKDENTYGSTPAATAP